MANGLIDDIVAEPRSKMRALIRQNSEKIERLAEDVVLPKHRRSMHRMTSRQESTIHETLPMQRVESDAIRVSPFVVVPMADETKPQPEKQRKYMPVFMVGLSLIQIILMVLLNKYNNFPMLLIGYDPHRRYEVWRFVLIMFVHTRAGHLWANMLLQIMLGVLLEIIYKWPRIALIYVGSVIGGSLFITLVNPNSYAVGASAGVYGLMASHLSTIILNWSEMDKKFMRISMLFVYIIVDIFINIELAPNDFDTNYAGHIGGAITGFFISILILNNFGNRQWKRNTQAVCVGILVFLVVVIVSVNIFAPNYYLPTDWNSNRTDYQNSYENFVYQRAIASPENSPEREFCRKILNCKILLNKAGYSSINFTTMKP